MRLQIRNAASPLLFATGGVLLLAASMFAPSIQSAHALTNCDVSDYDVDSVEMEFLDLINQYRADNGLNALTISTNLNRAAHWMSEDLGASGQFSHTDSLGRSPYQRAQDCGYPAGAGENLAAGTNWTTAQSAFTAWQDSPGHNANMLNGFYRQIGIARVQVPDSPYNWYWTTNFGATDDGTGGGSEPTQQPTSTPTATPTQAPPTATPTPSQTQPSNPGTTPAPTQTTPSGSNGGSGSLPLSPSRTSTPAANNTPSATSTPRPGATRTPSPTTTVPGSLALRPGINFIGWTAASGAPEDLLESVASTISVVYGYDPESGKWLRYGPGLPDYVNSLDWMEQGGAYWVFTN